MAFLVIAKRKNPSKRKLLPKKSNPKHPVNRNRRKRERRKMMDLGVKAMMMLQLRKIC
jgi:hypothetical protein